MIGAVLGLQPGRLIAAVKWAAARTAVSGSTTTVVSTVIHQHAGHDDGHRHVSTGQGAWP
jgi:hypothetical protein